MLGFLILVSGLVLGFVFGAVWMDSRLWPRFHCGCCFRAKHECVCGVACYWCLQKKR